MSEETRLCEFVNEQGRPCRREELTPSQVQELNAELRRNGSEAFWGILYREDVEAGRSGVDF